MLKLAQHHNTHAVTMQTECSTKLLKLVLVDSKLAVTLRLRLASRPDTGICNPRITWLICHSGRTRAMLIDSSAPLITENSCGIQSNLKSTRCKESAQRLSQLPYSSASAASSFCCAASSSSSSSRSSSSDVSAGASSL